MTRGGRIVAALTVLALSGGVALGLARLGTASAGPLEDTLDAVGQVVSAAEHAVVELFRGPGRASRLDWLDRYREEPELLRDPDRILLGAYEERIPGRLEGVFRLEDSLDTTFPLIHLYVAWGDRPDQRFPGDFLRAVRRAGSLPVLSWEPWLSDFRGEAHPGLGPSAERARGGLRAVAEGRYDFYVDRWARKAVAYGDPIFMRFGHEMNDPYRYPWGPQNNDPEDFVAAWRHVVKRFRAAGAENVIWVWSPHPAYGELGLFYPGDEWVDWVGTTALNYGTATRWSRWWSFEDTFGRYYEEFASFGKPVMIAELGSLAVGGDRESWYAEALRSLPERRPAVKSVLFFASSSDATVTGKAVDWDFADQPGVTDVVASAIRDWRQEGGSSVPGRVRKQGLVTERKRRSGADAHEGLPDTWQMEVLTSSGNDGQAPDPVPKGEELRKAPPTTLQGFRNGEGNRGGGTLPPRPARLVGSRGQKISPRWTTIETRTLSARPGQPCRSRRPTLTRGRPPSLLSALHREVRPVGHHHVLVVVEGAAELLEQALGLLLPVGLGQ